MADISKFIEMSELVGNENKILKKAEFEGFLGEKAKEFDYIALKYNDDFNKSCSVGKEGINKTLIEADAGIAETGTVVLDSSSEPLRRATSLCEELHVVLRSSAIVSNLEGVASFLRNKTAGENGKYIAFITGASRTADIEMSLTLGVHGPERMYVYLIEDM